MRFPRPDDLAEAPLWENYVVAQAASAALRLIPRYAYAVGVRVRGVDVCLVVQAPANAPERDEDIDGIVSNLQTLLGDAIGVTSRTDRADGPRLGLSDGVRWFFAQPTD
jgi:hypothetical protein